MRLFRIVLGIVAGFVVAAVLSVLTTTLLRGIWPELGRLGQSTPLIVLDASYAILWMFAGGAVAGRIGGRAAAAGLAVILLFLTAGTAIAAADPAHPAWYSWLLLCTIPPAAYAGGRIASSGRAPDRPIAQSGHEAGITGR